MKCYSGTFQERVGEITKNVNKIADYWAEPYTKQEWYTFDSGDRSDGCKT
jgi:hypothetical protein